MELLAVITGQETQAVNKSSGAPFKPKHIANETKGTFSVANLSSSKCVFFFPTHHAQVRKIKCDLKFVCGYYLHIKKKPYFLRKIMACLLWAKDVNKSMITAWLF